MQVNEKKIKEIVNEIEDSRNSVMESLRKIDNNELTFKSKHEKDCCYNILYGKKCAYTQVLVMIRDMLKEEV